MTKKERLWLADRYDRAADVLALCENKAHKEAIALLRREAQHWR